MLPGLDTARFPSSSSARSRGPGGRHLLGVLCLAVAVMGCRSLVDRPQPRLSGPQTPPPVGEPVPTEKDKSTLAPYTIEAPDILFIEAIRVVPVGRLVYASSSSVYGNAPNYPVAETEIPRPHSPYGVTKLAAEQLCSLYAANWGVPAVSLRYFTVYGPRQRPDMGFSRFFDAALAGRPLQIFGTGNQVRDFTYVSDVVAATLAASAADVPPVTREHPAHTNADIAANPTHAGTCRFSGCRYMITMVSTPIARAAQPATRRCFLVG